MPEVTEYYDQSKLTEEDIERFLEESQSGFLPVIRCGCGTNVVIRFGDKIGPNFEIVYIDPSGDSLKDVAKFKCPFCGKRTLLYLKRIGSLGYKNVD